MALHSSQRQIGDVPGTGKSIKTSSFARDGTLKRKYWNRVELVLWYCRAPHVGDAKRVMYSSVSNGVVHVLCACVQVQNTA